jgi:hypothetical protein
MLHDHIPNPTAARRATLAALLALAAGALGGCYPAGSTTMPSAPTTATVSASAWFPAGGAPRCVAGATWTYQLLSATGTAGSGTSIRSVTPTSEFFPDFADHCTVRDLQPTGFGAGLRPGSWRVTVLLGIATNSCVVNLNAGSNTVAFTFGVGGCS